MEFLTAEWAAALDDAASSLTAPADKDQTLQYHVGTFEYYVSFSGGRVRFVVGHATDPTVSFRSDRATAAAIAQGRLSAISAFMDGRLELGHDSAALASLHATLAALGDITAAVRERTRFTDA